MTSSHDARLLRALQVDSSRSIADLAQEAALSPSACHRRVKSLEAEGVITGYGARVDPAALGYKMHLFVEATLTSQRGEDLDAFERAASAVPEIIEGYLMAGGTDYILRIVARDVADFERLHRERLAKLPNIARLQSRLTLRAFRPWTGYPVRGA
ncbi:MAG TPA: Lrp/AsnC family transcriptional regulator [Hyphomicrobiaceae bacterium]|nr:Lrp/AsnC family transcriptional regulator [Hyphomicrobiaceae bacterium]